MNDKAHLPVIRPGEMPLRLDYKDADEPGLQADLQAANHPWL
jgi:hypothetical protein